MYRKNSSFAKISVELKLDLINAALLTSTYSEDGKWIHTVSIPQVLAANLWIIS